MMELSTIDVTAAIEMAIAGHAPVVLVVKGDLLAGRPVRTLEGVARAISVARDGRARVVLCIAEETEQVVLLDRVVRVLPAS